MIVIFEDSFENGLSKIKDPALAKRVVNAIEKFKSTNTLRDISGIKAMQGYTGFYRLRMGDYRIGFSLEADGSIILLKFGHRGEFYKYFPKNYA